MTDDRGQADADRFAHDPEKIRLLREVADEIREEDHRAEQLAAILYRVSDLYDPNEDTSPADIHRNVKTILQIKERGTLARGEGESEAETPGYEELEDLGVE